MRTIDFRFAPPIQQMTTCFPDDNHKTIVREDGSLNYHWEDPIDFEYRKDFWKHAGPQTEFADPGEFFRVRLKPRFTHRDRLISRDQSTESAQVPVVTQTEVYEHGTLTWTVFSTRSGLDQQNKAEKPYRADIILWKLQAGDDFGCVPSRTELQLTGYRNMVPPILESPGTTAYWTADGLQLPGLSHYAFLQSGDVREGVFAVVLQGELAPETVTVEWARSELNAVRRFWTHLPVFANRIQIPDTQVQDMLVACGRNILQAREAENGITEYKVGPTVYRTLFMVDGYFLLDAAHIMGDTDVAFHQGLLAVLRRRRSDGSMQIIPRHFKETGIAIATIVRQCELTGQDDRLTELWPTVLRAVDFIRKLRQEARELGPDYPGYDLFPPAYLDGGISGPYPDYTTPGWIMVGLKFAVEAAARIGLPGEPEIRDLYREIRNGFLRCAARDRGRTGNGIPYLPMIMEHREYNKPQSATWALAQTIYPGEVFEPDDDLVRDFLELMDSIDDDQGIPRETGWIHDQAIWAYSSMFYAQVWLYAGCPNKAIDYLYAFANHASPARVWREEQGLTGSHTSEYCGDMPHNWGSAEFIRLVRNSLVMERQGNLELLAGLPDEWLPRPENPLLIENTPTRFGPVHLELHAEGESGSSCRLSFSRRPGVVEPEKIRIHWKGGVIVLDPDTGTDETYEETLT